MSEHELQSSSKGFLKRKHQLNTGHKRYGPRPTCHPHRHNTQHSASRTLTGNDLPTRVQRGNKQVVLAHVFRIYTNVPVIHRKFWKETQEISHDGCSWTEKLGDWETHEAAYFHDGPFCIGVSLHQRSVIQKCQNCIWFMCQQYLKAVHFC